MEGNKLGLSIVKQRGGRGGASSRRRRLCLAIATLASCVQLAGGFAWAEPQDATARPTLTTAADVRALAAPGTPFDQPVVPASEVAGQGALARRVHVRGVVTRHRPGLGSYIRDGDANLYVESRQGPELRPGDRVDAAGFPAADPYAPRLEDAVFRRLGPGPAPAPVPVTAGQVVREAGFLPGPGKARLLLAADGLLFAGRLESASPPAPAPGSRLALTGVVCLRQAGVSFDVLLRSAEDIVVLEGPGWWTRERLLSALALLALAAAAGALWIRALRRRVRHHVAAACAERSRAEEDLCRLNRELESLIRERTAELQAQLSLLEATVESTADGILVVARDGTTTRFNRRFAEMWRLPDEVLATGDDDQALGFVRDQLADPEAFLAKVRELYGRPEATSFDVLEFEDGRVFERYSQPQRIGGEIVGRVWSFRDVTERRRMDEALRRNQYAIDHATEAILWAREDGRLAYVNESACRNLGYSREELLRLSVPDINPDAPPESWPERWRAIREAGHLRYETRARREDGTVFPIELTIDHIVFEGVEYAYTTGRDLTAQRTLEERARRAEQTALMGALTAGVAHEVRNPLFAIWANLDALEATLRGHKASREVMALLRQDLERLRALMAQFVDYGTPPEDTPSVGHLGATIEAATVSCAALAADAGVRIERRGADCRSGMSLNVRRLEQAFKNLLQNAVRHSPRGGVVEIGLGTLEKGGRTWVRCEVRDSGPGFMEGDLAKVFEPFFSRERGRPGLGLAIARRVVEEHGGLISAANREGGGAVVTVELPCLVAPATEMEPDAGPDADGR